MIELILNLLASHIGEISTFAGTSLLALLKRKLDRGHIKDALISKGVSLDEIRKII